MLFLAMLQSVHCTVYTAQCTLQYTIHSVHRTVYHRSVWTRRYTCPWTPRNSWSPPHWGRPWLIPWLTSPGQLYCNTVLSLYLDERRGVQGNTSMRSREFPRAHSELPRPNAGIFCTPRLESRYRHYPIYKSDEAVAIAIAIAMSRAIAMSKPREKRKQIKIFLGMGQ